jgi:glycolate oxidase iron-sulfur subunit
VTAAPTAPRCAVPGTPLADAAAGLDLCVHCGFCLQACPTYLAVSDENDSPRGRLFLMRSVVEGDLAVSDETLQTHIDRCLGCRACETACPSGVPYGHLLEATRATMTSTRPIRPVARVMLAVMARPIWRRLVFLGSRALRAVGLTRVLARLPGRAGFAFAMLESTRPAVAARRYRLTPDAERGRVAALRGCVMPGLFQPTNEATARTLLTNGYEMVPAAHQGCCGALHAHAGDAEGARVLARRNIEAFERANVDFIAVNAAGCGAMMKEYAHLFPVDEAWHDRATAISAKVRDVSELLAAAGPRTGAPMSARVVYDAPCHLHHAQRITSAPLAVLRAIPGLETTPIRDSEQCCGGAGIYNLVEPELSAQVLAPKLANVSRSGAQLVATGNPGCHMQIGAGLLRSGSAVRCVHPVDLLDASYAAAAAGERIP